ncbi:MAG: diguanylate cyclase [Sphingomonadales bacterium]|nr:diguanylate cyclase [Sphingomonadales bacterium]
MAYRQFLSEGAGNHLLDEEAFAVPAEIADELAVAQYQRIKGQIPWLHVAIGVLVVAGFLADNSEPRAFGEVALGVLLLLAVAIRSYFWRRSEPGRVTPEEARKQLGSSFLIMLMFCAGATIWTLAEMEVRFSHENVFAPVILVLGALGTASCYASHPRTAMIPLLLCNLPLVLVLVAQVDIHTTAVAMAVLMISLLQTRLIVGRYQEMLANLMLHRATRLAARTDPLTGLGNRLAMAETLGNALQTISTGEGPSVALIDLDGFKPVNDRHGHAAGDAVLVQVARRIELAAGPGAVSIRMGGDEFAVIFAADQTTDVNNRCADIMATFAIPFTYEGVSIRLGASMGLAQAPDDGQSIREVLATADRALYVVKAEHRAQAASGQRPRIAGVKRSAA